MSSLSPNSSAALPLQVGYRAGSAVPAGPLGLPSAVWLKIGVIAALMVALFWVNLSRLWAKTNPFTGQGNWEHAAFIPLVGLYYLYVWRDQLLGEAEPADRGDAAPWTLPGVWALLLAVPPLLLLAVAPVLAGGGGTGGVREFLGSLADRGLSRLVPYVFGAGLVAAAAAGIVYRKREELRYPATQAWLDRVWRGLGAWLMVMCVLWGVGFFAGVLAPSRVDAALAALRYAVAAVGVAGLAHVALRSTVAWRGRYDAVLAHSSAWFGAFVMLWGILFSFWGIWPGQNDFFKDVGMVVALFGVVTLVAGWRVMAVAWFPVVFLFVAVPWPDQVYSWVALPLQNFAARVGVFTLTVTGVDASQFGTKIVMAGANGEIRTLNVAEACAGLKSLMTFVFVSSAVAFLSTRLLWQKLLIVASAVPIAILCNAARVAGQGLLDFYVSRQWSENFAHGFAGLVMLIPGFFMILAVCWVLDHLFIEEADEPAVVRRGGAKPAQTATVATTAAPSAVAVSAAAASTPSLVAAAGARAATAQATPSVAAVPAPAAAPAKKVITVPKRVPPATAGATAAPAATAAAGGSPSQPAPSQPVAKPAAVAAAPPRPVTAPAPVTAQRGPSAAGAPATARTVAPSAAPKPVAPAPNEARPAPVPPKAETAAVPANPAISKPPMPRTAAPAAPAVTPAVAPGQQPKAAGPNPQEGRP